jgi:DNA replication protein DnaC
VRYQRLPRLLDELAMARVDGKYARLLARIAKIRLLILDDWAMAKLTVEQRRDLMEVIEDRYQRASTILATQVPIDRWHDIIGDPTYADAIMDRLVHNAYRIELRGESMRRHIATKSIEDQSADEKRKSNKEVTTLVHDTHTMHSGANSRHMRIFINEE